MSELTSGKFANGAITGAFIQLFNEEALTLKQSMSKAWKGVKNWVSEHTSAGVAVGGHMIFIGANAHYNAVNNSLTVCARIGPGVYLGGGSEVGISGTFGDNTSNWSGGIGVDVAYATEGLSGAVTGNLDSISASGNYKLPASFGIGASIGIDGCYCFK